MLKSKEKKNTTYISLHVSINMQPDIKVVF